MIGDLVAELVEPILPKFDVRPAQMDCLLLLGVRGILCLQSGLELILQLSYASVELSEELHGVLTILLMHAGFLEGAEPCMVLEQLIEGAEGLKRLLLPDGVCLRHPTRTRHRRLGGMDQADRLMVASRVLDVLFGCLLVRSRRAVKELRELLVRVDALRVLTAVGASDGAVAWLGRLPLEPLGERELAVV